MASLALLQLQPLQGDFRKLLWRGQKTSLPQPHLFSWDLKTPAHRTQRGCPALDPALAAPPPDAGPALPGVPACSSVNICDPPGWGSPSHRPGEHGSGASPLRREGKEEKHDNQLCQASAPTCRPQCRIIPCPNHQQPESSPAANHCPGVAYSQSLGPKRISVMSEDEFPLPALLLAAELHRKRIQQPTQLQPGLTCDGLELQQRAGGRASQKTVPCHSAFSIAFFADFHYLSILWRQVIVWGQCHLNDSERVSPQKGRKGVPGTGSTRPEQQPRGRAAHLVVRLVALHLLLHDGDLHNALGGVWVPQANCPGEGNQRSAGCRSSRKGRLPSAPLPTIRPRKKTLERREAKTHCFQKAPCPHTPVTVPSPFLLTLQALQSCFSTQTFPTSRSSPPDEF